MTVPTSIQPSAFCQHCTGRPSQRQRVSWFRLEKKPSSISDELGQVICQPPLRFVDTFFLPCTSNQPLVAICRGTLALALSCTRTWKSRGLISTCTASCNPALKSKHDPSMNGPTGSRPREPPQAPGQCLHPNGREGRPRGASQYPVTPGGMQVLHLRNQDPACPPMRLSAPMPRSRAPTHLLASVALFRVYHCAHFRERRPCRWREAT